MPLHELILLVELVHLSEERVFAILFNPSVCVVDKDNLWDLLMLLGWLRDRDWLGSLLWLGLVWLGFHCVDLSLKLLTK